MFHALYSEVTARGSNQTSPYYLNISDFADSFIQIPTSNVSVSSSTISSTYLAGRAALYDSANVKVGTCSASFLCMENADGFYNDISNYISVDSGLVVSWFTPTTLINLELDSIINSMVTECMVTASTKIGVNPFTDRPTASLFPLIVVKFIFNSQGQGRYSVESFETPLYIVCTNSYSEPSKRKGVAGHAIIPSILSGLRRFIFRVGACRCSCAHMESGSAGIQFKIRKCGNCGVGDRL